jgi:hypothetical protein
MKRGITDSLPIRDKDFPDTETHQSGLEQQLDW